MGMPAERIEMEALQLSPEERGRIAARLIASLDEDDYEEDPADVQRAWEVEIRRRIDDFEAGRTQPIPYSAVMAEARRIVEEGGPGLSASTICSP